MKDYGETDFLGCILTDKRVLVSHIAVYVTLFQLWRQNKKNNPIQASRRKIMRLAHIKSIVTYHKCVKDLRDFGYIGYEPSYHPREGSRIFFWKWVD